MIFCRNVVQRLRCCVSPCGLQLLLTAVLFAQAAAVAQETVVTQDVVPLPSIPQRIDLRDGDTLVFLGDSITHQRLYTQYVEDFFYTRFPERRIHFHNAGIGGARAWDARQRISRDVLDYKPRYVTILLGMNDGSYRPFDSEVFATYREDMLQVISAIREGGAQPILMSPTMFDARAARARGRWDDAMLSQYNGVLAYYGKWLQHEAIENGYGFVDMFGLLNNVTVEQRKRDPNFTLIRDAIHPDAPGQLVMAYAVIDQLGLRGPLSNIRIHRTANGKLQSTASGGTVAELTAVEGGLEFHWTSTGLPWVVPTEAQSGAELVQLGHRASREALTVHGLQPGRYELLIDGVSVGQWAHTQLAAHIELQSNDRTPQYQQALQVAMLNKQKNEGPVKQLRDHWGAFQGWARLSRQLAQQPENRELAEQVSVARTRVEQLENTIQSTAAAARAIEDQIYSVNKPVRRHYQLRLVGQ